jgi:hypothetical protein
MSKQELAPDISTTFQRAVSYRRKAPRTRPIPIRFTEAELAYLHEKAGKLPLSTYMRQELLGSHLDQGRRHCQPKVNQKEISALLAALGQSRLSSNMNQLAKAANIGVLDVSPDVEQQLQDAAMAVLAMRDALFTALGLKST